MPDEPAEVAATLDVAATRLAALHALGVQAPDLESKLADAREALERGDLTAAQSRADEIRIVVKLAAGEVQRLLNHGDGNSPLDVLRAPPAAAFAKAPAAAEPTSEAPEAPEAPVADAVDPNESERAEAPSADLPEQVAAVVEDAFGKALYSNALRQMVEIVAAERLREFLKDPELVGPLIAHRVRDELRAALAAEAANSGS